MGCCECGNKPRKENLLKLHYNKTAYVRELFFILSDVKAISQIWITDIFIFLKLVS